MGTKGMPRKIQERGRRWHLGHMPVPGCPCGSSSRLAHHHSHRCIGLGAIAIAIAILKDPSCSPMRRQSRAGVEGAMVGGAPHPLTTSSTPLILRTTLPTIYERSLERNIVISLVLKPLCYHIWGASSWNYIV